MAEDLKYSYDLIVIGAGPAGEKASAQAAYYGKRVALIEKEISPGGAAVHTGTLPSKTLREACLYLTGHKSRDLYGVAVELSNDATLHKLTERRQAISHSEVNRMLNNIEYHKIDYITGKAYLQDDHTVVVETNGEKKYLTGEYILITTGSKPFRPNNIPFESTRVYDTDNILNIPVIPSSITILGGGVIGCEYACMFSSLGTKVTLIDVRETIMPFLDYEIIDRLITAMKNTGVLFYLGNGWDDVNVLNDGVTVKLKNGNIIKSDFILFAAGRSGNTDGLNLESVGIKITSRGTIEVDKDYRTSVNNIFAAGDVIGFPALASTSMEQGRVAACHAFNIQYKQVMSSVLPYGIYTIPEVSAVGETEESAKEKNIDYVVGRALYKKNARGMITGDLEGITKLLVDRTNRRVIGVHVIGERATELVHIGQSAMIMHATVDLFIDMVFNFPTLAESYKYAAYDCLQHMGL